MVFREDKEPYKDHEKCQMVVDGPHQDQIGKHRDPEVLDVMADIFSFGFSTRNNHRHCRVFDDDFRDDTGVYD